MENQPGLSVFFKSFYHVSGSTSPSRYSHSLTMNDKRLFIAHRLKMRTSIKIENPHQMVNLGNKVSGIQIRAEKLVHP